MNVTQFLKLAQRESVLVIADLEEAVAYWQDNVIDGTLTDFDTIDAILHDLDTEGYVVYSDTDALADFLSEIDSDADLEVSHD